jgi:two-component system sensor kinase FixL
LVTLAALVQWALLEARTPFVLLLPAIMAVAWYGGLGPGLLATAVGTLEAAYLFFEPRFSFRVIDPQEVFALALFGFLGTAISLLCERLMQSERARRQAEERTHLEMEGSLQESRDRHRAVVEAAVDAIITIEERGIIDSVNPAAEKMFGYSAQELIGHNIKILMPSPHKEEHDGYIARYLATGEKRIIGIRREVAGLRKDGRIFPVDLSVAEARLGDRRMFVGIHRDISERKRAEEALAESQARIRAILEVAAEGIISIDERGVMQTMNPAAERIFGYSAEEVVGKNISMLMPSPYRDEHDGYIARYLATGEKKIIGIGREVVGLRKDDATFPMDLSVAEVRLENWRGFVGTIRDITERKRAENALQESKSNLEKTVGELQAKNEEVRVMTQQLWQAAKLASVGELAASIAHELNNPLATVSLRVESALVHTPADDPRRRALEIIEQETKRMGELVANLLQFSRRGQEEISTVDVRQELTKAMELIHHHIRKSLITVVQELPENTPIIYADRQKLRQVFLNLLTNASDAMLQGGTLTLRTGPAFLESGMPAVRIEISDTGVGIPLEHLGRVFDPFFTTKEEGSGTGLGLAICRRVVEEHHGTIRIVSEVGKGTTMHIVLPAKNRTSVDNLRGAAPAE